MASIVYVQFQTHRWNTTRMKIERIFSNIPFNQKQLPDLDAVEIFIYRLVSLIKMHEPQIDNLYEPVLNLSML